MLPIPQGVYKDFLELQPKKLAEKGIKLVLADLDNTLVAYGATHPTQEVIAWKNALEAEGITLFILSNSRKPNRVDVFAEALGVEFQAWSGKPRKKGFRSALKRMNATVEETIMVGDQIFTDILGATRMGIPALLVRPIYYSNVGQVLRYKILELPFRSAGRNRRYL